MNPLSGFIAAMKNTFTFRRRARRMEYGGFLLFSFIVGFVAGVLDAMFFIEPALGETSGPLSLVATIAMFVPGITVTARRLHDMGRSAWWMLSPIAFMAVMVGLGALSGSAEMIIPLSIAGIIFNIAFSLWLIFKDSQSGGNRWGSNPKDSLVS